MASILTETTKVLTAISFLNSVARTTPAPEILYLGIGKSDPWSNEAYPDDPIDNVTDAQDVKNNLIALKKILASDIVLMVPRYDWIQDEVYDAYSADSDTLFSDRFYVITSDYNVYKCLDNNSGQPSLVLPTGTSTSEIITGDGYRWKFMYNLSTDMVTNFLLTDWLPVPYGSQKTSFQQAVESSAVYSSGSPVGGHGSDASYELGAKYVYITQDMEETESGLIPINIEFRQVSVISNIKLTSTGQQATGNVYNITDPSSDIDLTTGRVIFFDNREATPRAEDQAEKIKLLISF